MLFLNVILQWDFVVDNWFLALQAKTGDISCIKVAGLH